MTIRKTKRRSDVRSKRRKPCPFKAAGWKEVDYKDTETLRQFITQKGKIIPRRITGVSACFQKKIKVIPSLPNLLIK